MYSLAIERGDLIRLFVGGILVLGMTFASGVFLGVGIGSRAMENPASEMNSPLPVGTAESTAFSKFRKQTMMSEEQGTSLPKRLPPTNPPPVPSRKESISPSVESSELNTSNERVPTPLAAQDLKPAAAMMNNRQASIVADVESQVFVDIRQSPMRPMHVHTRDRQIGTAQQTYTIQVGTFSTVEAAHALAKRLVSKAYHPLIATSQDSEPNSRIYVLIGEYVTKAEALLAAEQFSNEEVRETKVRRSFPNAQQFLSVT